MSNTPPNIEREDLRKRLQGLWFKTVASRGIIGSDGKRVDGYGLNEQNTEQILALVDRYVEQAVKEARVDELDQLWLASCERGCKKCDFKQIMTCNGVNGKDTTVAERRDYLRKQVATPHQKEEGGE